mmetsp:Transcript_11999/g.19276  ORF Transcript_11999/g.19276 Transcript_11999/m.19276 type:complete len:81 (+) Transcript_11999:781-1023(+)
MFRFEKTVQSHGSSLTVYIVIILSFFFHIFVVFHKLNPPRPFAIPVEIGLAISIAPAASTTGSTSKSCALPSQILQLFSP